MFLLRLNGALGQTGWKHIKRAGGKWLMAHGKSTFEGGMGVFLIAIL